MAYFAKYNCQHIDNWGGCKIHKLPLLFRWIGRPKCKMQQPVYPSRDGNAECDDEKPYVRPVNPPSAKR